MRYIPRLPIYSDTKYYIKRLYIYAYRVQMNAASVVYAGLVELKVDKRYCPKSPSTNVLQANAQDLRAHKTLTLAFYSPTANDPSWMNKLVAKGSRYPYCHCELIFDNGMATSIVAGGEVFLRPRTYASNCYTLKAFSVPAHSHDKMYEFAREKAHQHISFSNLSMLSPLLGWCTNKNPNETFCSKYIMQVLQHGDVHWTRGLNADLASPSSLYSLLMAVPNPCFNTVRFRLDKMKV